ncbi:hypothetical protein HPB50_006694 [Hyalomma asiaticum]|uniref:Uncharacterized protein n=1 Tax=Hyalomma asiaticum TaxID=266040 RepID=A0ACB7TI03_HYAAI|nr:hypothetical protein HPB50_006694 [Hyalomma asiaticum]
MHTPASPLRLCGSANSEGKQRRPVVRVSAPKMLEGANLDVLSSKKIRLQLEAKYAIDFSDRKKEIDGLVMELISEPEKKEPEKPKKSSQQNGAVSSTSTVESSSSSDDDDEQDDEELARKLQDEEFKSRSRAVKKSRDPSNKQFAICDAQLMKVFGLGFLVPGVRANVTSVLVTLVRATFLACVSRLEVVREDRPVFVFLVTVRSCVRVASSALLQARLAGEEAACVHCRGRDHCGFIGTPHNGISRAPERPPPKQFRRQATLHSGPASFLLRLRSGIQSWLAPQRAVYSALRLQYPPQTSVLADPSRILKERDSC